MNYLNETYSIIKVLHYHDLKVIKNEKEQNCSICDNPINNDTIIFSCEECSLNICPPCLQMLYLINEYKIPLSKLKLKNLLNHNKNCKPNFIIIPNENTEKQCDECKSSNNNFMIFCDTCKNFHLCLKCYSKSSNEKIALSYYFHEHPMKEIIMDNNHICDLCNGRGDFSFSSFQCKICDLDICEKCLDKLIIINQPINSSNKFLEFKKNKFFSCTKCKKDFKEERENEFCYMLSNDDMNLCIDCYCSNKKVNYEILNHRKNYITLFSNCISTDLINENESLRNNNSKLKLLLDALFIELLKEKKKNDENNENDEKENEEKSENDEKKEKSENNKSKEKSENDEEKEKSENNKSKERSEKEESKKNNENSENNENKENNKKEKKELKVKSTKKEIEQKETIDKLNSLIKEKENEVKKNKDEMNEKFIEIYNSKDQMEKRLNNEIKSLKEKCKGNNKITINDKDLQKKITENEKKIEELQNQINIQEEKNEKKKKELEKSKKEQIKKLNLIIEEKENEIKKNKEEIKKYIENEEKKNYENIIKQKDEKIKELNFKLNNTKNQKLEEGKNYKEILVKFKSEKRKLEKLKEIAGVDQKIIDQLFKEIDKDLK